jgi:HTH-type transcriptional regulator/antitoxin HigA
MSFSTIKAQARSLFNEAVFLTHIHNNEEYEQALAFMDDLIEQNTGVNGRLSGMD